MPNMDASDSNFGWNDAETPFYHRYLMPAIEAFLPTPKEAGGVLDIGCGNGVFVERLLEAGYDAYGVDAARDGVEIADRRHPGRFYVCAVGRDPLPERISRAGVRTVVSMEVVEHLYSPRSFADFAAEILRSNGGGTFILSTPYHGYLKNLFVSLVGRWDYHWGSLWEGGHIKFWSRRTMTTLLEEAGFRNVRFRGVGRFPYLWRHMVCRAEI